MFFQEGFLKLAEDKHYELNFNHDKTRRLHHFVISDIFCFCSAKSQHLNLYQRIVMVYVDSQYRHNFTKLT